MDYESHIGDYTQNIAFVPFIKRYRLIVAGGHENFRAGTLAHILLLLVERILYGLHILLEHQFIKQRQISGIVPDRIFYKQDSPYSHVQNVVVGIEFILEKLDNGNYHVRAVVPVEYVIYVRSVPLFDERINLF